MERNEQVYNWIVARIAEGMTIQVTTYYSSNLYTKVEYFKFNKNGVFVRAGKGWNCIYAEVKLVDIRAITN
jgi:hypothetical protein